MPDPSPPSSPRRGLYFLANDDIHDFAVAFLNSLARHAPDLPVCLIPGSGEVGRILELQEARGLDRFEDEELLATCDSIAERFHGAPLPHYRKLACWHGPYDEFLYLDTDMLVLGDLAPVFDRVPRPGFLTSHSNLKHLRRWVWKPGIEATGALTPEQIDFSASTGFLASQRGVLGVDAALEALPAALELAPHMTLFCCEQPFLNYLMVTHGAPCTSLYVLRRDGESDLPLAEVWAGREDGVQEGDRLRFGDELPLVIHWAGLWRPTRWDRVLDRWRAWTGAADPAGTPTVRRRLPYRELWERYRWEAGADEAS